MNTILIGVDADERSQRRDRLRALAWPDVSDAWYLTSRTPMRYPRTLSRVAPPTPRSARRSGDKPSKIVAS